jgi:hypothetical protein
MTKRLGMFGFAMTFGVLLCGSEDACDDQGPPTLSCDDLELVVQPGTCVVFQNPCENGSWLPGPRFDGFRLCEAPPSVSLRQTRMGNTITREICVAASSPAMVNEEIDFVYGIGSEFGTAQLILSTVSQPLSATADAFPTVINPGESSQLTAIVTGGAPPYTFAWTPTGSGQAPIVSPSTTTTYQVRVGDRTGTFVTAEVTVTVNTGLTVVSTRDNITAGDQVGLRAIITGGTPPYTYSWTPVESLSDPSISDPVAQPTHTTEYTVVVTDSVGVEETGSITIHVTVAVAVSATPNAVNPGESSQLQATVVGGLPPYTYSWTPPDTLNDPTIADPLATPTATTDYTVVVTDSEGFTAQSMVTVSLLSTQNPPPVASFTYRMVCCPTLNLDASSSTGNIVSYTWDLSWTTANPDRITTGPTTSFAITELTHGTVTLTVTAADGQTSTAQQSF